MNECDHIVGYAEGTDEYWICYESCSDSKKSYIYIHFNYCPLCGERLKAGNDKKSE